MVKGKAEQEDPGRADPAPAEEPKLPYLLGKWHGMTQYRCPQCPFDSLEEEAILLHIAMHYVDDAAAPGSGLVLVADKSGNVKP